MGKQNVVLEMEEELSRNGVETIFNELTESSYLQRNKLEKSEYIQVN